MPVSRAEAGEAPAPYLFLRQIAKDVTVRVSEPWSGSKQQPLSLCSVASTLGLLVAATSKGLALYDLSQLRETFQKGERNSVPTASALHTFDTETAVQHITFADHDARLICVLVDGRLLVWETASLRAGFSAPGMIQPPEAHSHLLALEANPGDRGKQLVAGCQTGEIVQLTPEGEVKATLPPPPDMDRALYVDDVQWLENHVFLVTYNSLPASVDEPSHEYELFVLLRDAKADHLTYASLPLDVAPPFGDTSWWGKRYIAALRTWSRTKHLIFMGSTASTDVGVISCDESLDPSAWNALELEETSRIVLPFSSVDGTSDTAPLGVALDLTATERVLDPNAAAKGEDPSTTLPPMPILFIYTSDGVLMAYHVIHAESTEMYPGMVSETRKVLEDPKPASTASPATQAPAFGSVSAFGSSKASAAPAFGSTTAFGSAASTAKPAFGASFAYGAAASSTPAFGAPSAFGSAPAFGKPSLGSGTQSAGFGAFGGSSSAFANVSSNSSTSAFGTGSTSAFGSGAPFGGNSAFSQASSNKSAFGSSAFTGASTPSAFGTIASQGNVFGSGGSFHTPKTPAFATAAPKPALETKEKEPIKETSDDNAFSFGAIGHVLDADKKEPLQEQSMSEEVVQKEADVDKQGASDTVSEQEIATESTAQEEALKGKDPSAEEERQAISLPQEPSLSRDALSDQEQIDADVSKLSEVSLPEKDAAPASSLPPSEPKSIQEEEASSTVTSHPTSSKPLSEDAKKDASVEAQDVSAPEPTETAKNTTDVSTSALPLESSKTTSTPSEKPEPEEGEQPITVSNVAQEKPPATSFSFADLKNETPISSFVPRQQEQSQSTDSSSTPAPPSSHTAQQDAPGSSDASHHGQPVLSAFGSSAFRGSFTQTDKQGVLPAFSRLSETKDERPPMAVGLPTANTSVKAELTRPAQVSNKADQQRQTPGVRLSSPVPQIDLSQPIVATFPSQDDELQTEFFKIFATLNEELNALKTHARDCSEFFQKLKQHASSKKLEDVQDMESWVFADMNVLEPIAKELTQQLQKGVSEASNTQHRLDGLESLQLKADIKKDEIARFLRARQDPEFAKLVRIRHLGPEHMENQWRLRRWAHLVRERMQELEDFLSSVQRSTSLEKKGMTAMRAPSLDSIHRSADNITRIVLMRISELEKMEQDMSSLLPNYSERTTVRSEQRPLDSLGDLEAVLPSLEHAAADLSSNSMASSAAEALLSARTEPLLTRASDAQDMEAWPMAQVIELRRIRRPNQVSSPEKEPPERPAPEPTPTKRVNFLATSTPHGVDYGAARVSSPKPLSSAFRTSTLPQLASSQTGKGIGSDSIPQQYTTFEGLVLPEPVDTDQQNLTLEEFVAQDEAGEDDDQDYDDQDSGSYSDGYDDYEEDDFGDEVDDS
ncbi:hypothetical protein MNAN1_000953 [Malassezia nana]|uniref:Nucleoporin Nup159/Nup146 N-terminal domain-containing protein n=1 Tax=Malassezia nana TaxID=180528 RepID=A0AAF0EHQ7_9BASI|nr:hypothetical protein MNAN1_000953 [Malassezia nana]